MFLFFLKQGYKYHTGPKRSSGYKTASYKHSASWSGGTSAPLQPKFS